MNPTIEFIKTLPAEVFTHLMALIAEPSLTIPPSPYLMSLALAAPAEVPGDFEGFGLPETPERPKITVPKTLDPDLKDMLTQYLRGEVDFDPMTYEPARALAARARSATGNAQAEAQTQYTALTTAIATIDDFHRRFTAAERERAERRKQQWRWVWAMGMYREFGTVLDHLALVWKKSGESVDRGQLAPSTAARFALMGVEPPAQTPSTAGSSGQSPATREDAPKGGKGGKSAAAKA